MSEKNKGKGGEAPKREAGKIVGIASKVRQSEECALATNGRWRGMHLLGWDWVGFSLGKRDYLRDSDLALAEEGLVQGHEPQLPR